MLDYSAFKEVKCYSHIGKGSDIAFVDRVSKTLYINTENFNKFTPEAQAFIIAHEEGHLKGGLNGAATANEQEADLYAFKKIAHTTDTSLKDVVKSIMSVLGSHPQHRERIYIIYAYALAEDWVNYGNKDAYNEYYIVKSLLADEFGFYDLDELPVGSKSGFVITASAISIAGLILGTAGTGFTIFGGIRGAKRQAKLEREMRIKQQEAAEAAELATETAQGNAILNMFNLAENEHDKNLINQALVSVKNKQRAVALIGILSLGIVIFFIYRKFYKK